jgi:hypothetical protein
MDDSVTDRMPPEEPFAASDARRFAPRAARGRVAR